MNNAQPALQAGQVNSAVIAPIKVINVAKPKPQKNANTVQDNTEAVKIRALSAEEQAVCKQPVVYEKNVTVREVMVYR
jgi:hypothetical protein